MRPRRSPDFSDYYYTFPARAYQCAALRSCHALTIDAVFVQYFCRCLLMDGWMDSRGEEQHASRGSRSRRRVQGGYPLRCCRRRHDHNHHPVVLCSKLQPFLARAQGEHSTLVTTIASRSLYRSNRLGVLASDDHTHGTDFFLSGFTMCMVCNRPIAVCDTCGR